MVHRLNGEWGGRVIWGVIMALGLLLTGCSSSTGPSPEEEEFVELIYGTWNWIRAEGGIAGVTLTPQSEGFSQTLVLSPGLAELFQDDQLLRSTTFEFLPALDLGDEFRPPALRYAEPLFGGFEEQVVGFDLNGVDLVLADPCCDGFIYTFEPFPPFD